MCLSYVPENVLWLWCGQLCAQPESDSIASYDAQPIAPVTIELDAKPRFGFTA